MPEDERNTPTCVGKTAKPCERMLSTEKHPHVRGEDDWERRNCWNRRETPPRAWGRLVKSFSLFFVAQKHPHVRGEDDYLYKEASGQRETPPRAWGRRIGNLRGSHKSRNTPTCVGKTGRRLMKRSAQGKHPHVRGEDPGVSPGPRFEAETPPRAWGRLSPFILFVCRPRNTPTCVGKTRTRRGPSCMTWKHPHVRGEDAFRLLSLR